jgi:hypothetical protein
VIEKPGAERADNSHRNRREGKDDRLANVATAHKIASNPTQTACDASSNV